MINGRHMHQIYEIALSTIKYSSNKMKVDNFLNTPISQSVDTLNRKLWYVRPILTLMVVLWANLANTK